MIEVCTLLAKRGIQSLVSIWQKRLEPAEGSTSLSQVWKAGMLPVSMAGPWIKSSVQSLTLCGVRGSLAETADCWVLFALELCSEDSGTWVQLASTISSSECSVSGDWSLLSVVTGVSEGWGIPLHDLTCRPSPPALLKWRAHLGQISFGHSLSAVVICWMEQDFWCSIRPEGQSNDCWQRLQKVPGWASGRGRCGHNVKCLACPHSRLNDLPQNWQENPQVDCDIFRLEIDREGSVHAAVSISLSVVKSQGPEIFDDANQRRSVKSETTTTEHKSNRLLARV